MSALLVVKSQIESSDFIISFLVRPTRLVILSNEKQHSIYNLLDRTEIQSLTFTLINTLSISHS